MAYAIALITTPTGKKLAYACQICEKVFAAEKIISSDGAEVAREKILDRKREEAEGCCRCSTCNEIGEKRNGYPPVCKNCWAASETKRQKQSEDILRQAKADVKVFQAELAKSRSEPAAKGLIQAMRSISENEFDAGWHSGLEVVCWKGAIDGTYLHLLILAVQAGGWWTWPEGSKQEVFVPLDDWITGEVVMPLRVKNMVERWQREDISKCTGL